MLFREDTKWLYFFFLPAVGTLWLLNLPGRHQDTKDLLNS